jgi:hypothetical protein
METTKIITLASFVYIDKIESFKKYLQKRFNIKDENIFEYNFNDDNKKILTYRIHLKNENKVNISTLIPPTIIVHKKGECFYTINALNKLVELIYGLDSGNINHLEYKINWDDYQNKIIIIKNDELKIIDITKDFSKK